MKHIPSHDLRRAVDSRVRPTAGKRLGTPALAPSGPDGLRSCPDSRHTPSSAFCISGGRQSPGLAACGAGAALAAPPAAGGSAYLESSRIPVTGRIVAVSAGCKSRFCPTCCVGLGIKLKRRLIPVLDTFRRVMMLTFTVDPRHFAGPLEAFEHVKKARCLSVTMQALRRAGVLLSDRWFCVIEWQANGWPHWHVLVDAEFIPFETLADAWNRNLRKLGRSSTDTRTGFGCVRFSVRRFEHGRHAANYACAYLTKPPRHGYPAWVLGSDTRKVHRYSTSRGFWSGPSGAGRDPRGGVPAPPGPDHDDHGDVDDTPPVRSTIVQQLESCGQATVILREVEEADEATGEVSVRRQFLHKICEPLLDFIKRVGCIEVNGRSTRAVLAANLLWLSHASSAVT